jgi:hypothetical protein
MDTIWKYELKLQVAQTIPMPQGAEVLTVQVQKDTICLWARHNLGNQDKLIPRTFVMHGTGNEIDRHYHGEFYIGTVQLWSYVWHVFESR